MRFTPNNIVEGISKALFKEFGGGYEIYTESIRQGLKEPCFSVKLLNSTTEQRVGEKYYTTSLFCVHYFPITDKPTEIFDVQERLYNCLEYIEIDGDLARGTGMNAETHDGVLFFFVDYNAFVFREPGEIPTMETVDQRTNLKG